MESPRLIAPAESPLTTQIMQQRTQRDEYQKFTVSKVVIPAERVLRDLYNAAVLTAKAKCTRDVSGIFRKIVSRIPEWTDDEVSREFSENPADIDACIRTAVKAHATMIALSRGRACKQVIKVPNAQAFFRKILTAVAADHEPEMFAVRDLSQRQKLRTWIAECVINHLVALVPISLFAAEDDEEEERKLQASEPCNEQVCPMDHKIVQEEATAAPISDVKKEEPAVPEIQEAQQVNEEIQKEVMPEVKEEIKTEEKVQEVKEEKIPEEQTVQAEKVKEEQTAVLPEEKPLPKEEESTVVASELPVAEATAAVADLPTAQATEPAVATLPTKKVEEEEEMV